MAAATRLQFHRGGHWPFQTTAPAGGDGGHADNLHGLPWIVHRWAHQRQWRRRWRGAG